MWMRCSHSFSANSFALPIRAVAPALDRLLETDQCRHPRLGESGDPTVMNALDRHHVEVIDPLPSADLYHDEVGAAQHSEMLDDHMPPHAKRPHHLAGCPGTVAQQIEDRPPSRIGQGPPYEIVLVLKR